MAHNPALRHMDAAIRRLVTLVRDNLYSSESEDVKQKRVVVNYDPFLELSELPQIVLENFTLLESLFYRQIGYEEPEKDIPGNTFTQRMNPLYVDLNFMLIVVTDKARDLIPLHERLVSLTEANPYLQVGVEDGEPYEAYEYGLVFDDPAAAMSVRRDTDHLHQLNLRGTVEAVRIYSGIALSGTLVSNRVFRIFTIDGATQLEELMPDA